MVDNPLVSVVIPTYKRTPDLIERSIQSVLNQTHKNLELIIVDDSPKNFSDRDLVSRFINELNDDRVHYIRHEENKGANIARNTGIKNSKGDYLAFLDDDDEWFPEKLEMQVKKISKENIGLVYCKAIEINEKTGKTTRIINEMHSGYQYRKLLKQNFIGSNSFVLIRREAIEKVGYYDENLPSHQDYDLFLRIAKKYEIDNVPEPLVKYYIHEGERISTDPEKVYRGRLCLHKKFTEDIETDPELALIWKIKSVPLLYKVGKRGEAFQRFLGLLVNNPFYTIRYIFGTLEYVLKKRQLL